MSLGSEGVARRKEACVSVGSSGEDEGGIQEGVGVRSRSNVTREWQEGNRRECVCGKQWRGGRKRGEKGFYV